MVLEILKEHARLLSCLIVLFNYLSSALCSESDEPNNSLYSTALQPVPLGGSCLLRFCSENQSCNENFVCQCLDGYRSDGKLCVLCSGENGNCTRTNDCCSFHFCINGICRKPGSTIEFITLTKISLGITFAIILAGVFIFLMKGLLNFTCGRYQQFQREEDVGSITSGQAYARQFLNQRPPSYEIRLDKPPSYEECTRSSTRGLLFESPPPYVISTNIPADLNRNEQTTNSVAFSTPNLTPLNVQSLGVTLQQSLQAAENSPEGRKIINLQPLETKE